VAPKPRAPRPTAAPLRGGRRGAHPYPWRPAAARRPGVRLPLGSPSCCPRGGCLAATVPQAPPFGTIPSDRPTPIADTAPTDTACGRAARRGREESVRSRASGT